MGTLVQVDRAVVHRLIVARLATELVGLGPSVGGKPLFVPPGRPQPAADEETELAWCSIARMTVTPFARKTDSVQGTPTEPASVGITLAINVAVNGAMVRASAYALSAMLGAVRDAIAEMRLADAATKHAVEFRNATMDEDVPDTSAGGSAGTAGGMTGVVMATGIAQRIG